MGISIHQTAGFGDMGFIGRWTLEITCVEPVIIYAEMLCCQIQFWEATGERELYTGKYVGQSGIIGSRLYQEKPDDC